MWVIIGLAGFFGFFVYLILLVIRAIKGKPKKSMAFGMLMCVILFVVGVSLTPPSNTGEKATTSDESKNDTSIPSASLAENIPEIVEQMPLISSDIVGTDLFEDVYVPFALWEKARIFEGVKVYAENCGYEYEIVEPSETTVASAKFFSGNDYVYVAYMPDVENIEIMTIVSYYQESSNSEVSMSNYSTGRNRAYDKFQIHVIGEQNTDVSGIDEQREFLFAQ